MRRVVSGLVIVLVAAACRDVVVPRPQPEPPAALLITESPSPFREVAAGPVRAVIPDAWQPRLAGPRDDPRQGFVASPRPGSWNGDRPPVEGFAAVWVDGTRVGVPSDYYYLAATKSALDILTRSRSCSATRQTVVVDHVPTFASGSPDSPGDYLAHGQGTCAVGRTPTKWAYFVAAPGYGPVREVGIPNSSLYVVVAVMPDGHRTEQVLTKLLMRTQFGGATMRDFISAARAS